MHVLSEKIDMNNDEKRIINNFDANTTIWTKYSVDNEGRNNTAAEIYQRHLVPAGCDDYA
jgi:hypothetical protein